MRKQGWRLLGAALLLALGIVSCQTTKQVKAPAALVPASFV